MADEQTVDIKRVEQQGTVLMIRCAGKWGEDAAGSLSARKVIDAMNTWIDTHPEKTVGHLYVDFSEVKYAGGEGPVSILTGARKRKIENVTFQAGGENQKALAELFESFGFSDWVHLTSGGDGEVDTL